MLDVGRSASVFMTAFSTPPTGRLYKHSLGSCFLPRPLVVFLFKAISGQTQWLTPATPALRVRDKITVSLDQPELQPALRTA